MSISTISVRVPEQVRKDLRSFERDEKLTQTSEAARKLLLIGLESWRKEKALKLLGRGEVTFSKAAQIAQLNVWDFAELVRERRVTWITNKEMILKDISAAL